MFVGQQINIRMILKDHVNSALYIFIYIKLLKLYKNRSYFGHALF